MSMDPEFVTMCGRCGHPSDADPCEQCQGHDDTTIVVSMLPVVGGPCNGQTAPAAMETVHLTPPTGIEFIDNARAEVLASLPVELRYTDGSLNRADGWTRGPSGFDYRRRAFIIGDPTDREMAHMITVFYLDTPTGLGEAATILRAMVATFALLAGSAW